MQVYQICLLTSVILLGKVVSTLLNINLRYSHRPIISNYVKNRLLEYNPTMFDVGGDSDYLNYYYINAYLGESRQKTSLILDTGSSIMCTTCKETCKSCGKHENPNYDSSNSSNFSIVGCNSEKCSPFSNNKSCNNKKCAFQIVSNK